MLLRIVLLAFSLSLLCAPSAHAASIFVSDPVTNTSFAIAFDPAGDAPNALVDLSGGTSGNIFDDVAVVDLGPALALVLEPGNTVDLTTLPTGALSIAFLFDSAVFADTGVLTLNGTGTEVLFNAALAGFVGPVVGTFGLVNTVETGEGIATFYQLERIVGHGSDVTAVPEPASLTLLGIGLAGVAARRRKARR